MPTNGGIIRGSGSIAYSMKVDLISTWGIRDPFIHVYGICGQGISGSGGMLPECRSDL